jgi:hypothetical protein
MIIENFSIAFPSGNQNPSHKDDNEGSRFAPLVTFGQIAVSAAKVNRRDTVPYAASDGA